MSLMQLFIAQEREAITAILGGGAFVWLDVLLLGCLIAIAPYLLTIAARWRSGRNQAPAICLRKSEASDKLVNDKQVAFLSTELPRLGLGENGDRCVIFGVKDQPLEIVGRQLRNRFRTYRIEAEKSAENEGVGFQYFGLVSPSRFEELKIRGRRRGLTLSNNQNQIYLTKRAIRSTKWIWNDPDPSIRLTMRIAVWVFAIQLVLSFAFWWFPRS